FFKKNSLSVPSSPAPQVKQTSNQPKISVEHVNPHIRQESLDTLNSSEFRNKVDARLNTEEKENTKVKVRLKRSMTMSSEKKLEMVITVKTSKDDHSIVTNVNRISSWSKLLSQLMMPL